MSTQKLNPARRRNTSTYMPLLAALLLAGSTGACSSEIDGKPKAKVAEAVPQKAPEKKNEAKASNIKEHALDAASSGVGFVGAKVTGDHKGGFKTISGKISLDGDKPTSIEIAVDTTSIFTDAEKLTKHLRSADFFGVDKFPTASFKASSFKAGAKADEYDMNGELDLHGVKKAINVPVVISIADGKIVGSSEFTINRKDFGIVYAGMPDDLIKDEVLLKLDLNFK